MDYSNQPWEWKSHKCTWHILLPMLVCKATTQCNSIDFFMNIVS
jgi:hypothetical protein